MNEIQRAIPACETDDNDVWMPSSCGMCLSFVLHAGHRVDGVVVKIEGNPDSAVGKGRLCAKGVSAIMTHYDPNRLRVPLRRTNPGRASGSIRVGRRSAGTKPSTKLPTV